MERPSLNRLLQRYAPQDSEQLNYKQRMLDFLSRAPDCFERACAEGHFTGSALLLNYSGDKALLMHHRKLGLWMQLGGHCDGDPDILQVAIKEAQEESGIVAIAPVCSEILDLDIHEIPACAGEPAHLHYDVRFLLQAQEEVEAVQNHESLSLKWFDGVSEPLPTSEPTVLRLFEKWQAL